MPDGWALVGRPGQAAAQECNQASAARRRSVVDFATLIPVVL